MMENLAVPPALGAADQQALARIHAARPILTGMARASEAMSWPHRTLLHAGPAFDAAGPVAPVLHSAAHAATLEGWAADFDQAIAAIRAGDIRLAPAQEWDCVVPLAAVLSPTQWVQIVEDRAGRGTLCLAPLNAGTQYAPRLGQADPAARDFLRWQNGAFASHLAAGCTSAIDLLAIADQALTDGDDCHGRTLSGTRQLVRALQRGGAVFDAQEQSMLEASAGFFLTTWMAASRCMLSAADDVAGSTVVVGMGGNGRDIGVRLAGLPRAWSTVPATAPRGALIDCVAAERALPAIGDSAVVEALGLGALAMHHSPAQSEALGAFMPAPPASLARSLLAAPHPALPRCTARVGLLAERVSSCEPVPVALGILDREGLLGRIGGGVYAAPATLFEHALSRLR